MLKFLSIDDDDNNNNDDAAEAGAMTVFLRSFVTANLKYRQHSKECMWRQRGHFYMVFHVYDSKVTWGKGEAHVALY